MLENNAKIVISYLNLWQLHRFFDACGHKYDFKCRIRVDEKYDVDTLKYVLDFFPNAVIGARICGLQREDAFLEKCEELIFENCKFRTFYAHKGVKKLVIKNCELEVLDLSRCESLRKICVYGCNRLRSIIGWENLKQLRVVDVKGGWKLGPNNDSLRTLVMYGEMWEWSCEGLRNLNLSEVVGLSNLDGLKGCRKLKRLWLDRCEDLVCIEVVKQLALRELYVSGCRGVNLDALNGCGKLRKLEMFKTNCANLDMLSGCGELVELRVTSEHKLRLKNIDGLRGCRKLKCVAFNFGWGAGGGINLKMLAECEGLEEVDLKSVMIRDVLGKCKNLQKISLEHVSLTDASGLNKCEDLRYLRLTDVYIESAVNLDKCEKLETLMLKGIGDLYGRLTFGCKSVKNIEIVSCGIRSLDGLEECKGLIGIRIDSCERLMDVGVLEVLEKLENVSVIDCNMLCKGRKIEVNERLRKKQIVANVIKWGRTLLGL